MPLLSSSSGDAQGGGVSRRNAMGISAASLASICLTRVALSKAANNPTNLDAVSPEETNWKGTTLPLLSLDDAHELSKSSGSSIFPFAQWPDPLLRRPASRVAIPQQPSENDSRIVLMEKIQSIAKTLRQTAHEKGAVGLAAQQCGIDVSLVYLRTSTSRRNKGLFLLNPRIVARSPEQEMMVWREECLVLPPSFRATLLRDATITVEYETIFPSALTTNIDDDATDMTIPNYFATQQITLEGELARAAQHEMQHDQGILILDHVGLDELPLYMQEQELKGHSERMQQAFSRDIGASSLVASDAVGTTSSASKSNAIGLQDMETTSNDDCNEACLAERKRKIEQRRAMMKQSRTNTNRQDVFELSRQRAAMYNTTYRGADCPTSATGIALPCI